MMPQEAKDKIATPELWINKIQRLEEMLNSARGELDAAKSNAKFWENQHKDLSKKYNEHKKSLRTFVSEIRNEVLRDEAIKFVKYMNDHAWQYDYSAQKTHSMKEHWEHFKTIKDPNN